MTPHGMRSFSPVPGPVTAMAAAGTMSAHLAGIEKVSNGFIVRFQKAQKVTVKKKTLNSLGFDADTMEIVKLGLEKMKQGDEWKEMGLEPKPAEEPLERWITTSMAIACKDETELLAAIREAVTAHKEIEKLMLSGEFSGDYIGGIV